MITRSFGSSGQFTLTDWTQELNIIPNEWGFINSLGIFEEESVAEHTVTFESITSSGALIVDKVRGERNNVSKDYTRQVKVFSVPHFPLDDYIYPKDIQGVRAYGSADEAETLAAVRTRKMERIMRNHAWTLEAARAQLITAGTVYAPSNTVSQNWFTEFSVTQTQVDMLFGTSTTDIIGKVESAIAAIQDNAGNGGEITGVICLCGSTFFSRLINHPRVQTAYQYYTSTQEPLRNRLGGSPTAMHRTFQYGGVTFYEMRDAYNGVPLINAVKAYFVPTGTEAFRTYFGPAERFGIVNTLGERAYLFEKQDPDGMFYQLQSESNFVNACMRPAVIVEAITSN